MISNQFMNTNNLYYSNNLYNTGMAIYETNSFKATDFLLSQINMINVLKISYSQIFSIYIRFGRPGQKYHRNSALF